MWDTARAERYEQWFESPKGEVALRRQRQMIAGVVSAWPRRGRTLLEIGCGAGHFLELFYGGGFDVSGVDASEPMLERARARMGNKVTLRTGNAEHLPFDDGSFDYAAMITALEYMDDPETALAEAFRVATHGVLIAFLNPWSLYRAETRLTSATTTTPEHARASSAPSSLRSARWFSPLAMYRLVRRVSGKRPATFRSVLFTPSIIWRYQKAPHFPWLHVLPFGAVAAMRVDMVPVTGTALPLPAQSALAAAQYPKGM